VGRVDVVMVDVAADLGVRAAERGVKGVRILGESSVLAERRAGSTGVLPDRRRFSDICRESLGTAVLGGGITSGVRLLGERGCCRGCSVSHRLGLEVLSSARSSGAWSLEMAKYSARWWCFQECAPGALMERSCSGGRPGMVARRYQSRRPRRPTWFPWSTYENPSRPPGQWSWAPARGR
jgi:hypothetical protein